MGIDDRFNKSTEQDNKPKAAATGGDAQGTATAAKPAAPAVRAPAPPVPRGPMPPAPRGMGPLSAPRGMEPIIPQIPKAPPTAAPVKTDKDPEEK